MITAAVHQAVGNNVATNPVRCRYLVTRPGPYCINDGSTAGSGS